MTHFLISLYSNVTNQKMIMKHTNNNQICTVPENLEKINGALFSLVIALKNQTTNPHLKKVEIIVKQIFKVQPKQYLFKLIHNQIQNSPMSVSKYIPNPQHQADYSNFTIQELQADLKNMRQSMQILNGSLNNLLGKYQLSAVTYFQSSKAVHLTAEKQAEIITKQIQNNKKLIQQHQKDQNKLLDLQKLCKEKDYLVQLENEIIKAYKQIHDKKKETYDTNLDVKRKDNKLLEIDREIQYKPDSQFQEVKIIKYYIAHQLRKYQQNDERQQQLQKKIDDYTKKDQEYTKRLDRYIKIAQDKSLPVSVNRPILDMISQINKLQTSKQQKKKEIVVIKRSQKITEEKVLKDIVSMEKQLQYVVKKIDNLEDMIGTISSATDNTIKQHDVGQNLIKPISYRFDQSLIHSDRKLKQDKPYFKIKSNKIRDILSTPSRGHSSDITKHDNQTRLFKVHQRQKSFGYDQRMKNDKNTIELPLIDSKNQQTHRINKPKLSINRYRGKDNLNTISHDISREDNNSSLLEQSLPNYKPQLGKFGKKKD